MEEGILGAAAASTLDPGGGLYSGPGGGMYTGPCDEPYHSNIPSWPVLAEELEKRGMKDLADLIRAHFL